MEENRTWWRIITVGVGIFVLVFLFVALKPFTIIGAGQRGVVSHFGKVSDEIYGEGIHFYPPIGTSVKKIGVQVKSYGSGDSALTAGSAENQSILVKWAVNWHINPSEVNKAYQEIGDDDKAYAGIITARVEQAVKNAVALIPAKEAIQKGNDIKSRAFKEVAEGTLKYHIILDDLTIVDVDYLPAYNAAIEDSAKAQQQIAAEENKTKIVKEQAEQAKAKAQGDADAVTIRAKADAAAQQLQQTTLSANLLQKMWIEKWNGGVPTYVSGNDANLFFNIPK